jgi:hypothetical protein
MILIEKVSFGEQQGWEDLRLIGVLLSIFVLLSHYYGTRTSEKGRL